MPVNQSANDWLALFCEHLMRLRPDVRLPSAVQRAVSAYPLAQMLTPEEAAVLSAQTAPASSGTPRRAHGLHDNDRSVR